ncbi:MAG: hypothetical protein IJK97_06315, partial [Thermoguttaceae bacterium]|nr:hypothetical protein [Thermoguttaceae bacterium]
MGVSPSGAVGRPRILRSSTLSSRKNGTDPLLNECVARTYSGGGTSFDTHETILPVLKIPAAKPLLRDANDWEARFETVRSTFDSRIGQICNAAFNRSVIAYDESLDPEARQQL